MSVKKKWICTWGYILRDDDRKNRVFGVTRSELLSSSNTKHEAKYQRVECSDCAGAAKILILLKLDKAFFSQRAIQ